MNQNKLMLMIKLSKLFSWGLLKDVYAAVDNYDNARDICLQVLKMMKGSDIGAQEKETKLLREWETFTSVEGEQIESYFHRFISLVNHLDRNKHTPKTITSNIKFLDKLPSEWSRYVTLVNQTKDLHELEEMVGISLVSMVGIQAFRLGKSDSGLEQNGLIVVPVVGNQIRNIVQARGADNEEEYIELLELVTKTHVEQQNNSNGIPTESNMDPSEAQVEHHPTPDEETRAYHESLYNNFSIEVKTVNKKQQTLFETTNLLQIADESLKKIKVLEHEIERISKASDTNDNNPIILNISVSDNENLQTELARTKKKMESCIVKKEQEFAKLLNDWSRKCDECKYDKISYDNAYNKTQHKIKRLQDLLGEVKEKRSVTQSD
uniref:Gag-Pol polyprotein n=1 Tax=Tanacetum cinerariifolium TaxID=118510 RepID=A0A699GPW6_TANCI|nr:Gag-Pol polyprotein [Tanacetum cinerariifolium]